MILPPIAFDDTSANCVPFHGIFRVFPTLIRLCRNFERAVRGERNGKADKNSLIQLNYYSYAAAAAAVVSFFPLHVPSSRVRVFDADA